MAGTMEKDDVKLSFMNIKQVNWGQVQKVCGKGVPNIAKEAVADAVEKLDAKKLKKPYVKIGLIKKDLFLRIKDGNDHVQDVKLVANWTDPGDVADDPVYERTLADFSRDRENVLSIGNASLRVIKDRLQKAEEAAERAEGYAGEAERGADRGGDGIPKGAAKAKALADQIETWKGEAQQAYDTWFAEFDRHRSIKADALKEKDKVEWGINFFMRNLRPLNVTLTDNLAEIETCLKEAKVAVEEAEEWGKDNRDAAQAYLKRAKLLATEATEALEAAKKVLLNQGDIQHVAESLVTNELESIKNGDSQENRAAKADQAGQKMKLIANGNTLVTSHMKKIQGLVTKLSTIPRANQTADPVKTEVDKFKKAIADSAVYKKHWDKWMKTSLETYAKIKKAMAT